MDSRAAAADAARDQNAIGADSMTQAPSWHRATLS
jgi:hypothetical protein